MSSEDLLDHGRRIAELERKVNELSKIVGGVEPASGFTYASDAPSSAGAAEDPRVLELVNSGNKIAAIKLYRELTGVGLKEAKEAVEEMT